MGIFFWIHSVALVEDLNIDEEKISSKGEYVNAMEASYNQVSQTKLMLFQIKIALTHCSLIGFNTIQTFCFSERNELLDCGSLIPRNPLCFRAAILDEQSINVQRVKTTLFFFQHTNLEPALITFIYDHSPRDLIIMNTKLESRH